MLIDVGPRRYELRVIEGRLFFNDEECQCRCDHDQGQILISDRVPHSMRLELAARAVNETWARLLKGWTLVPLIGDVPSRSDESRKD